MVDRAGNACCEVVVKLEVEVAVVAFFILFCFIFGCCNSGGKGSGGGCQ